MTSNIEVFKQNSIRITSALGRIYVDPFGMEETPKDAAFLFITHEHYDHFSPKDVEKVACENTVMIVPAKMEKKARELAGIVKEIITVKPCEKREVEGLSFETVPAYNLLKPFHPKSAEWVGYLFEIDGKRIYVAGDTDATKEAKSVMCDVALIPIGGTYTMDAKKAAELVNEMKPAVVIPVHYGEVVGKPSDGEEFAALVKDPVKVDFKMKFK